MTTCTIGKRQPIYRMGKMPTNCVTDKGLILRIHSTKNIDQIC